MFNENNPKYYIDILQNEDILKSEKGKIIKYIIKYINKTKYKITNFNKKLEYIHDLKENFKKEYDGYDKYEKYKINLTVKYHTYDINIEYTYITWEASGEGGSYDLYNIKLY